MEGPDERTRVLTHLVGRSRAYLLQLDDAKAGLAGLRTPDLELVLVAVEGAVAAVAAVDSIATSKLRDE